MFHKASLQEVDDASVAAEVRDAIAAAQRRVVGVVVNAVDDSLAKGEQIDTRWTHDEIKILPTLLHEAKAAHRIVILLADHGHVVDHQAQGRRGEGGERWRIDDAQPAADELQLTGSRVLIPANHRLIAPWTEKVRYGVKKNGYHGGVSPQEMVIPITVLCASDARAGWMGRSCHDHTSVVGRAIPGAAACRCRCRYAARPAHPGDSGRYSTMSRQRRQSSSLSPVQHPQTSLYLRGYRRSSPRRCSLRRNSSRDVPCRPTRSSASC